MGGMEQDVVLLGKRITAAREAKGWSRSDLARRASVDPSYVTRIEDAQYKRPSIDKVNALAGALGIRVTDLTEPKPSEVPAGTAAALSEIFRADEAREVADILMVWARHSEKTRKFILKTMKPLVLDVPDSE
jgi:transcriptional regulator with XRE-family HTH domain